MGEVVDLHQFKQEKKRKPQVENRVSPYFNKNQVLGSVREGFDILYGGKEPDFTTVGVSVKDGDVPRCNFSDEHHAKLNFHVPLEWMLNTADEISDKTNSNLGTDFKAYVLAAIVMKDELDQLVKGHKASINFGRKILADVIKGTARVDDITAKETLLWQLAGAVSYRATFLPDDEKRDTFLNALSSIQNKELVHELETPPNTSYMGMLSALFNRHIYKIDSFRVGILSPLELEKVASVSNVLLVRLTNYDIRRR